MKLLVLLPLSAALLFVGCGEKSSSEGSDSVGASAEPSADTDVERLLKEAVDMESLEERDDLAYQNNEPFSGWGKMMYDSGQVRGLVQLKDGKHDGLQTYWYKNGQKKDERTFKDGKLDGLMTKWHENGQKKSEGIYKDGEEVSAKYWNSKGEEVETIEEAGG